MVALPLGTTGDDCSKHGAVCLIGLMLLLGIVTKSLILLVDYTLINLGKSAGGLIDAGMSCDLMTSLSTVAGQSHLLWELDRG